MTKRIAVCGKGGVGKTTVVCGIVNYLIERNLTPILIVDADPNSNLAESLGLKYDFTVADIREELRAAQIPQGLSKAEYVEIKLQEALVEYKNFDLLVMGRPEGRECYCYVNELLRTFLSNLSKNYKYVVIDTEAGMEHLSRRTTDNIDTLIVVTIPTKVSFDTAKKILDLIPKLELKIYDKKILLNLAEGNFDSLNEIKIDGIIHKDDQIYLYSQKQQPLLGTILNTKFYSELKNFLDKLVDN
jgi:CO dehydrogenase maturation factor